MPDIVVYPNLDPRILVVSAPATEITMQELVDLVREWEDSTFGMGFPYIISGAGKEDLGGGVSVGITNTLINARLRFEARPAPLSTGVCTADDALGKTLNATGADFIADTVTPGCTVYNRTTGAMETVISVDSTSIFSFTLKSGTRQTWLIGDDFAVYPNELCSVTGGNLVAVDSNGNTIDPIMPSPNNYIVRTSSASATLQELSAIQYSSFADGVWISTTGTAGTTYPKGTPASPVNNLADAHTIIAVNGFTKMFFLSDWTFPNGTVMSGHELWGQGLQKTTFTFESGCILALCEVFNAEVTGNETGIVGFVDCLIYDLGSIGLLPSSVNVLAKNCLFKGTVTLPSNYSGELTAVDCWALPDDNGNPPIVDMGDSTANLQIRNWSGLITLKNCTNEIDVRIFLTSGGVTLDPSVTAGDFLFAGVGTLTNNSTSVTALDTDGLMSKETIGVAVWDEPVGDHLISGTTGFVIGISEFNDFVHIDVINGLPGTTFPLGTPLHPVDNLDDAITIAELRGFDHLHIQGNYTFDSTAFITGYTIVGDGLTTSTFTFTSGSMLAYCKIKNASITGAADGIVEIDNCLIYNASVPGAFPSSVSMIVSNSLWKGTTIFPSNYTGVLQLINCVGVPLAGQPPTLDMNGGQFDVQFRNYSGFVFLKNCNFDNDVRIFLNAGGVTLDPTVTAGSFNISGVGTYVDNSTSVTSLDVSSLISQETISEAVWDEPIGDHLIANTMGHEMYHLSYEHMVTIDTVNGSPGTTYPIGTHESPVNNLLDALTIANTHNFHTIHIDGILTINGENVEGYTFKSERSLGNVVAITSMDNTGTCYFTDLTVSGALTGGTRFTTCVLGALTGFDGGAKNCLLTDNIDIVGNGANYFTDCDTYVVSDTYKEISVNGNYLNIIRGRGSFGITNFTGSAVLAIDLVAGQVKVFNSCVSGTIVVSGLAQLTDESAVGCTVLDAALTTPGIATAVADEDIIKSIDKKTKLIPGLL